MFDAPSALRTPDPTAMFPEYKKKSIRLVGQYFDGRGQADCILETEGSGHVSGAGGDAEGHHRTGRADVHDGDGNVETCGGHVTRVSHVHRLGERDGESSFLGFPGIVKEHRERVPRVG